ncbi:MAG: proprotein convertase P-domain-containing protein [Labilithrix sp.]|nr:proprotein convertase P-domain-containing protein [Labilithrix sp.]MCW5814194.1 proprotein convertase P-domain-containing protein [Labilithrix sp.]
MRKTACGLLVLGFLLACGSSAEDDGAGAGGKSTPNIGGVTPGAGCKADTKEACGNGKDDDCDGLVDCADPDCSGVGSCPVCGAVERPEATPLPLPDGNDGEGVPYEGTLNFTGFGVGQVTKGADLVKICVTMEHSWLRDLEIKVISPSGKEVILSDFRGRDGTQIRMGTPNMDDLVDQPIAGTGAEYCWAPDAPNPPMLDSEDAKPSLETYYKTMTPGTYRPVTSMDALVGSDLNGKWTIRVTDRWSLDNGFIFGWSIAFKPELVKDCSVPIADLGVK